jgi:riboflavin synthase
VFTGLVEDIGTVVRADRRGDALVLVIRPVAMSVADVTIGESVSHDGVCLTVTAVADGTFTVLAGAETLSRTTLGDVRVGTELNLERALKIGDRLGGHMVAGHVDGVGTIVARRDEGANLVYRVGADAALLRYVVEKGSVAVDGISLTVNKVDRDGFEVAVIPHTAEATTLTEKHPGARVNLEVDIIGKYVEKLLGGHAPVRPSIDLETPLVPPIGGTR